MLKRDHSDFGLSVRGQWTIALHTLRLPLQQRLLPCLLIET